MRSGLRPGPDHERTTAEFPGFHPLAAQIRAIFEAGFERLLQDLFAQIDDELFKLSDKADNSRLQALYFDAMRLIRREKNVLQTGSLHQVLDTYDRFWNPTATPPLPSQAAVPEYSAGNGLSLLENDALDIELAVNNAVQQGNFLFQDTLGELELRFAALRGIEPPPEATNPIAPEVLCRAFAGSLATLPIDIRVTLVVLKLFDRHVLCKMGAIYRRLNDLLAEHGVVPDASNTPKARPSASPGDDSPSPAPASPEEGNDEALLRNLLLLLDRWRPQAGNPPPQPTAEPGGKRFDPDEVVNALSLLQQNAGAPASDERELGGPVPLLKQSLVDQLTRLLPEGEHRRLGQFEEDIIDMVSMIFDFILEDRNLPDPVKALIARLQIPVVKVAIIERSFLAKKTHPLRQLLNALAQAGVGLDSGDKKDQTVLKKIEEVVYRILTEFDEDTCLFAVLLDDFSAFVDREGKGIKAMEERTRQATASQERLALAKRAAAVEIAARVDGRTLPSALVSLLLNAWKDVLVIAYLRKEKEPADWEEAVSLMDRLIAWAASHDGALPLSDTGSGEPEIIQAVRNRLENISFDPVQRHAFLKDVERWHRARHTLGSSAGMDSKNLADADDRSPPTPAGREASTTALELGDLEEILIHGVEGTQPPSSTPDPMDEKCLEQARNIHVGDWVEFCDNLTLPFRGKLLLKSQLTSRYVFVNRRGMKLREIGLHELAQGLASNTIRLITGANEPLLDRALGAVVDTLERSAKQCGAPVPIPPAEPSETP
ncbi:DUF1631 domain-containing protein [Methylococcus geothermalis]|uniref:DUF1631 family protein n=1 Tax=Methylococcus geothermalis TaxID=2681310 RepID=A0A858Q4W7_9GAMM|nr:DUF1631 domain-containing protein [Methylococcus geothermalis]QJD28871.1 DUF1631 family protein [Methylococcus geothermalis]